MKPSFLRYALLTFFQCVVHASLHENVLNIQSQWFNVSDILPSSIDSHAIIINTTMMDCIAMDTLLNVLNTTNVMTNTLYQSRLHAYLSSHRKQNVDENGLNWNANIDTMALSHEDTVALSTALVMLSTSQNVTGVVKYAIAVQDDDFYNFYASGDNNMVYVRTLNMSVGNVIVRIYEQVPAMMVAKWEDYQRLGDVNGTIYIGEAPPVLESPLVPPPLRLRITARATKTLEKEDHEFAEEEQQQKDMEDKMHDEEEGERNDNMEAVEEEEEEKEVVVPTICIPTDALTALFPGQIHSTEVYEKMNSRYVVIGLIGKGSTTYVHQYWDMAQAVLTPVAIQTQVVCFHTQDEVDQAYLETKMMLTLSHPNILSAHEVYVEMERNKMKYVLDLAIHGDLRQLPTRLSVIQMKTMLTDITTALQYVHAAGYIHRDIKPANILYFGDHFKLSDFGKALNGTTSIVRGSGTLSYFAPELNNALQYGLEYGQAVDVWALGATALELTIGIRASKLSDFKFLNRSGWPMGQLLFRMLDDEATTRITCDEILKHDYFNHPDLGFPDQFQMTN